MHILHIMVVTSILMKLYLRAGWLIDIEDASEGLEKVPKVEDTNGVEVGGRTLVLLVPVDVGKVCDGTKERKLPKPDVELILLKLPNPEVLIVGLAVVLVEFTVTVLTLRERKGWAIVTPNGLEFRYFCCVE